MAVSLGGIGGRRGLGLCAMLWVACTPSAPGVVVAPASALSATAPGVAVWENRGSSSPTARAYPRLAYDEARGQTLMFGGTDGVGGMLPGTWTWDGDQWTSHDSDVGPEPRAQHALVYHAVDHVVYLIGGTHIGTPLAEMWRWDGSAWTAVLQLSGASVGPYARVEHAVVYDRLRGRLLLYGGRDLSGFAQDDLWAYQNGVWTLLEAHAAPGVRAKHLLAYDEARDMLVLGGGTGASNPLWELSLATMTWQSKPSEFFTGAGLLPVSLTDGDFTYDVTAGQLLAYNSIGTFRWNGNQWLQLLTPANAYGRKNLAIAYDRVRERGVLFGGFLGSQVSGDVFELVGNAWSLRAQSGMSPRAYVGLTYSSFDGKVHAHGGDGKASRYYTWEDGAWRSTGLGGTLGRDEVMMARLSSGTGLIFGGTVSTAYRDLTRFIRDQLALDPCGVPGDCIQPSPRSRGTLVADDARDGFWLFGGRDAIHRFTDLWFFARSNLKWSPKCTSLECVASAPTSSVPIALSSFAGAFDRPRDELVVVVDEKTHRYSPRDDVWTFVVTAPTLIRATMVYDETLQVPLLIGSRDTGAPVEVYALIADAWVNVPVAANVPAPSGRKGMAMAYDAGRKRVIVLGGEGAGMTRDGIAVGETWELHIRGNGCADGCETNACVDGVCCAVAACGECATCGAASDPGVCTPVVGVDEDSCAPPQVCGATSHCGLALGSTCADAIECADLICDVGRCGGDKALGAACGSARECRSLSCVDGVCCDGPCEGTCHACHLADPITGRVDGQCRVATGADPHGECTGSATTCAGLCGADGACLFPGTQQRCDTCLVCDGTGNCGEPPLDGRDKRCAAVDCSVLDTECRSYEVGAAEQCTSAGRCAGANDPGQCAVFRDVADGTLCAQGRCEQGECVSPVEPPGGCALSTARPSSPGAAAGAFAVMVLLCLLLRRRARSLGWIFFALLAGCGSRSEKGDVSRLRSSLIAPGDLVWELFGGSSPTARYGHALAFDSVRGETVLFGGSVGGTWEWNGERWRLAQPLDTPTPQIGAPMAFDAARALTFYAEGVAGELQTWTWDGAQWALACAAGTCGALDHTGGVMAYHAARSQLVLLGGSSGDAATTYLFGGSAWSPAATTAAAPPATAEGALSYDSVRQRLVLVGATVGSPEVWEWDGDNWTSFAPSTGPTQVRKGALADLGDGRVLFVEGFDGHALPNGNYWAWNGATWSLLGTDARLAVNETAMIRDPQRSRVVLFGGFGASVSSTTYEWSGSAWLHRSEQVLEPIDGQFLTFDRSRGLSLLIGGGAAHVWNGGSWAPAQPPPVAVVNTQLPYHEEASAILLFARLDASKLRGKLWRWTLEQGWTEHCPTCVGPLTSDREYAATYHGTLHASVFFGGYSTHSAPTNALNAFDSAWYPLAQSGDVPSPRVRAKLVYDRVFDRLMLLGGSSGSTELADAYVWKAGVWRQVTSLPSSPLAAYYNDSLGCVEVIAGRMRRFCFDAVDENASGQWTHLSTMLTHDRPGDRDATAATYDATRGRVVLFGGSSSGFLLGDTWESHTRGQSCAGGAECETGRCVDGVCCERSVCGVCESCSLGGGECAPVVNQPDPDSCAGELTCSANAECKRALGGICTSDDDCASAVCFGGACVAMRLVDGQVCALGIDCVSGLCVDGVCCKSDCAGECRRCDLPDPATGMLDGECRVPVGADPDADCFHGDDSCAGACSALGACGYPDATQRCALCLGCNGAGECLALPQDPEDPRCPEVSCEDSAPACQRYVTGVLVCVAPGACPTQDEVCNTLAPVDDDTPCEGGTCMGGRCTATEVEGSTSQCAYAPGQQRRGSEWFGLWGMVLLLSARFRRARREETRR